MFGTSCRKARYGPRPWQVADIIVPKPYDSPANTESPVVVWIHGGGWVRGSRAEVRDEAREFTRRTGIISLNIDYWLWDGRTPCWTRARSDIRQAIAFACGEGIPNVTGPVFLVGYSAGGTLAVKLALEGAPIEGVATIGSPLDLQAWHDYTGQDAPLIAGFGQDWALENPARQTHSEWPGLTMLHGSEDWLVPAGVNRSIEVGRLVTLKGGTHDCHERLDVVLAEVLKAFLR